MDMETTQEGVNEEVKDDADLFNDYLNEEDNDDEQEGGADSQESEETEDTQPETSSEPTFTVKINGVDKQVTQSELIAHYQKGEASDQRFQEAAAMRKQAESQQAQLQAERAQAVNVLNTYITQLEGFLQQAPNPALIDTNPAEYLRQQAAYQNLQTQLQQAQQQQSQLRQAMYEEERILDAHRLQEESQKLTEVIPEWKDETKARTEKEQIKNYLKELGYSEEALSRIQDHREVLLVRKAMLFDKALATAGKNKVQPKAPRVESPGGGQHQTKSEAAFKRLSKSGSINDAADVFMNII